MATKTFKIGEYCKGGIITVETKGSIVHIIAKEWDMSQGTRKNSNQKTPLRLMMNEYKHNTNQLSKNKQEIH